MGRMASRRITKTRRVCPAGLIKLSGLWDAPLPDYSFKGWEDKGCFHLSLAYIVSAIVGIVINAGIVFCWAKY